MVLVVLAVWFVSQFRKTAVGQRWGAMIKLNVPFFKGLFQRLYNARFARTAQMLLFVYLFSAALGTLVGGPVGDRIGRRLVIWWSILGSAPFALMMPYANFEWTIVLSAAIGFIISSAFSAILVYAQELLPMKVGLVSGIFFGFAFGIAGIATAGLG